MKNGLAFGRRGQGKSTLALSTALKIPGGVVIYDPKGNTDGESPFRFWAKSTTSDPAEFDSLLCASPYRVIVYRPSWSVPREFEFFVEQLRNRVGFTVLVDEASQLQKPAWLHPGLDWLVRLSPSGVRVIQTMHRPSDSATICRSLATDWFLFRTTLRRDLDVIEDQCGEETLRAVKNFSEGSHHYYHWDEARGRGRAFTDPAAWKVKG